MIWIKWGGALLLVGLLGGLWLQFGGGAKNWISRPPPITLPPAIEEQRTDVTKKQVELSQQEARLQLALEETRRMVAGVRATVEGMNANLTRLQSERLRIIESGTVDEVLALGRRLGYHPTLTPGCPNK